MHSKDYRLNSYDRASAERTLDMHLSSGRLSPEDHTSRKLLIAVAENSQDLENIFTDLGGTSPTSHSWHSQLRRRGRQLEILDIICLSGFIICIGIAQFVLNVEWTGLLLLGIFLVPMIPRLLVGLNSQEELLYYEMGMKKKK